MKTALWISWKELIDRKFRFSLNIALVCLAVGFCISIELLSKSREQAVESEINFAGPAIRIAPAGISEGDLIRFKTGETTISEITIENLFKKFPKKINTAEGRLLLKKSAGNYNIPVIGFDPGKAVTTFSSLKNLKTNEAALGWELAKEIKKKSGDIIDFGKQKLIVKTILPASGNVDDAVLFVLLPVAQKIFGISSGINEIRIFPASGVSTDKLTAELQNTFPGLNVLKTTRSDVAEHKLDSKLRLYRTMLYVVTGIIMAISLMISAYLNGNERKLELATFFAIGSSGNTVLLTLLLRAIIVGLIGSLLGYISGAIMALIQDYNSAAGIAWSLELFLKATGVTIGISIIATVPVSIAAGYRSHVMILQEE